MKKCSICEKEKSLDFFYKNKLSKDGFFKCCKECSLERNSKRLNEKRKQNSETIGILLDGEIFKDFDKNLLVSNFGRVFLKEHNDYGYFNRARFLPQTLLSNGYFVINYNYKKRYVHRLVADLFIKNLKKYSHVNHIDSNKTNNHFSNLEWCTHLQNIEHATRNDAYSVKLNRDEVLEIRKSSKSRKELSNIYNVSTTNIGLIINKKIWKHV